MTLKPLSTLICIVLIMGACTSDYRRENINIAKKKVITFKDSLLNNKMSISKYNRIVDSVNKYVYIENYLIDNK